MQRRSIASASAAKVAPVWLSVVDQPLTSFRGTLTPLPAIEVGRSSLPVAVGLISASSGATVLADNQHAVVTLTDLLGAWQFVSGKDEEAMLVGAHVLIQRLRDVEQRSAAHMAALAHDGHVGLGVRAPTEDLLVLGAGAGFDHADVRRVLRRRVRRWRRRRRREPSRCVGGDENCHVVGRRLHSQQLRALFEVGDRAGARALGKANDEALGIQAWMPALVVGVDQAVAVEHQTVPGVHHDVGVLELRAGDDAQEGIKSADGLNAPR